MALAPQQYTFLPSGARTTTQNNGPKYNKGHRGIRVTVVTTVVGSANLTAHIERFDDTSATWVVLLSGTTISTNTTNTYTVYPGGPVTTNVAANAPLSPTYRVRIAVADANPATYSCGVELLP